MGSSAKPFIIVGKYGQHVVLLFHLTVSLGRGLKLQYSCHGGHFDKVISFLICIISSKKDKRSRGSLPPFLLLVIFVLSFITGK